MPQGQPYPRSPPGLPRPLLVMDKVGNLPLELVLFRDRMTDSPFPLFLLKEFRGSSRGSQPWGSRRGRGGGTKAFYALHSFAPRKCIHSPPYVFPPSECSGALILQFCWARALLESACSVTWDRPGRLPEHRIGKRAAGGGACATHGDSGRLPEGGRRLQRQQ